MSDGDARGSSADDADIRGESLAVGAATTIPDHDMHSICRAPLTVDKFVMSTCSLAEQDNLHRLEQDHQVEEQGMVLDVVKVVLKLLLGIFDRGAIVQADLGPSGDP